MSGEDRPLGVIEFHRSGEWTGVYLDGKLVRYGDHCLADEWLQDRAGVVVVDDPAWLPDGWNPLGTLDEVAAEADRRSGLAAKAARLREEAEAATKAAEELERQLRPPWERS